MEKNKNNLVTLGIAAVVAIAAIGIFARSRNVGMFGDRMMDESSSMMQYVVRADVDSADYKSYSGLKGEDYDRQFLSNMITHHEGAVEMANLALKNAKHQEIKDLAKAIVAAQTSEIGSMTAWQKDWGYPASNGEKMMDHSAMGMMDSNASMMQALEGKSGDDFDKAFLAQMIMHHQSALNMAAPGRTNASHQEVKDLVAAIITAQTKEIQQMKQWQKSWGY